MRVLPEHLYVAEAEAQYELNITNRMSNFTGPYALNIHPQTVLELIAHYRETTEDVQSV